MLDTKFSGNFIVSLFGVWERYEGTVTSLLKSRVSHATQTQSYPIWGLCYYMQPPQTLSHIASDPLQAIIYVTFMLGSCAFFSRMWISVRRPPHLPPNARRCQAPPPRTSPTS